MVTADMAAALAFYRRLGLDIPADADSEPHVEAATPSGVRLAWDTVETILSFAPDWKQPSGEGLIGLAFRCDDPAEVDAVYAGMTAAGYESGNEPWDAAWGQRYAVIQDPDGNSVSLYAPLTPPPA